MQGITGDGSANTGITDHSAELPADPSTQASQDMEQSPERCPGRKL